MTARDHRPAGPLRGYRLGYTEAGYAEVERENGEGIGRVWKGENGRWWAIDRNGKDMSSDGGHPSRRDAVAQVIEEDLRHGV